VLVIFVTSKDYMIYPITLVNVRKEASFTYTYEFTKPENLDWEEGAHTHLALDNFNHETGWFDKKDIRHLSITSLPEENKILITTRILKNHSYFKEKLLTSDIGDMFYLFKVGSRLTLKRENKDLVLLSAGVGIVSFRPVIQQFVKNPENIESLTLINIDSSGEFLLQDQMNEYHETNSRFNYYYVQSRELFYDRLREIVSNESYYYIVGSDDFLKQVRMELNKNGVSDDLIVFDKKPEFYKELNMT